MAWDDDNMTTHLPECPTVAGWHCICDFLRKAEQRGYNDAREFFVYLRHIVILLMLYSF